MTVNKYSKGDWVRVVSGEEEGRTFTIVHVIPSDPIEYVGYFCGRVIRAPSNQLESY